MIPGLWSILDNVGEFPQHLFTVDILVGVALVWFAVNVCVASIFMRPRYEDLEHKTMNGPIAHFFGGNLRVVRKCLRTHQLSRAFTALAPAFGSIFVLQWPFSTKVVVSTATLIENVIEDENLTRINPYSIVFERGLLKPRLESSDAATLCADTLDNNDLNTHAVDVCTQICGILCDELRTSVGPSKSMKRNLAEDLKWSTLQAIWKLSCGTDVDMKISDMLETLLGECQDRSQDLFLIQRYSPMRFLQAYTALSTLRTRIAQAMKDTDVDDKCLIREILKSNGDNSISDDAIIDQVLLFILTAYDTVWPTIAWVLYEISRLGESSLQSLKKSSNTGTDSGLQEYINKSMHRHPVVGLIEYESQRVVDVAGFYLPKGVRIVCNLTAAATLVDTEKSLEKESQDSLVASPTKNNCIWDPFNEPACSSLCTKLLGPTIVNVFVAQLFKNFQWTECQDKVHIEDTTCRPHSGLELTVNLI